MSAGDVCVLTHENGSRAVVALKGATVLSWTTPANGDEHIFVSSEAKLDTPNKAIRGGIPIVFPQFGQGQFEGMKQHGFARQSMWTIESAEDTIQHRAVFILTSDMLDDLSDIYPFEWALRYTVELGDESLECELQIISEGPFSTLLHTYLNVSNVLNTSIHGLEGASYFDKVDGDSKSQDAKNITIQGETDSIYRSNPALPVAVTCPTGVTSGVTKKVTVSRSAHFAPRNDNNDTYSDEYESQVVVWNPWIEKAKAITDLDDSEYSSFVCVEPGVVKDGPALATPQAPFLFKQRLSVEYENSA